MIKTAKLAQIELARAVDHRTPQVTPHDPNIDTHTTYAVTRERAGPFVVAPATAADVRRQTGSAGILVLHGCSRVSQLVGDESLAEPLVQMVHDIDFFDGHEKEGVFVPQRLVTRYQLQ